MAMGACMKCGKTLQIQPRGNSSGHTRMEKGVVYHYNNPRWLAWFPVPHESPEGGRCEGDKIEIK